MSNEIFSRLSVLYVEDEPLISLDAMNALEKCGFKKLSCAYTLKSAKSAALDHRYDCAILDIRLERGQNSVELGSQLADQGVMVILASGNGLDQTELAEKGFKHFFIKPYNIDEIIQEIEQHFNPRLH